MKFEPTLATESCWTELPPCLPQMITLLATMVTETPYLWRQWCYITGLLTALQALSTSNRNEEVLCLDQHIPKAHISMLYPTGPCWKLVDPAEMGLSELSLHHWGHAPGEDSEPCLFFFLAWEWGLCSTLRFYLSKAIVTECQSGFLYYVT